MRVKVRFVFDDWRNCMHQSVYHTKEGIRLSRTDFHSGTIFEGYLELDNEQIAESHAALEEGYYPTFSLTPAV